MATPLDNIKGAKIMAKSDYWTHHNALHFRNAMLLAVRRYKRDTPLDERGRGSIKILSDLIHKLKNTPLRQSLSLTMAEQATLTTAIEDTTNTEHLFANPRGSATPKERMHLIGED